jgi:hypothetical protein
MLVPIVWGLHLSLGMLAAIADLIAFLQSVHEGRSGLG